MIIGIYSVNFALLCHMWRNRYDGFAMEIKRIPESNKELDLIQAAEADFGMQNSIPKIVYITIGPDDGNELQKRLDRAFDILFNKMMDN